MGATSDEGGSERDYLEGLRYEDRHPASDIGSEGWLRERFSDKDWHRHRRTDGRTDLCDGTPSDCASKARLP